MPSVPSLYTHLTNNRVPVARLMLVLIIAGRDVFDGILEAVLRMAVMFLVDQFSARGHERSWGNTNHSCICANGDG